MGLSLRGHARMTHVHSPPVLLSKGGTVSPRWMEHASSSASMLLGGQHRVQCRINAIHEDALKFPRQK